MNSLPPPPSVTLTVSAFGIMSVTAMHLFGSLRDDWALGAVLALCGVLGGASLLRRR